MSSTLLSRTTMASTSSIRPTFAHKVQSLCTFTPMAPFTSISQLARKHTRITATTSSTAPASLILSRFASTVPGNGPVRPIERPISPHVTIYQFPIAAISSITNRATGVALSVGVIGAGLLALGGACDIPSYTAALHHSAPFLVPIFKAAFAFPLVYHYLAGLRHLYWDSTAKGLDMHSVDLSTQILFGSSAVITIILAFTSL